MTGPPNATISVTPFKPTFSDDELRRLRERIGECRRTMPRVNYAMQQEQYGVTHEWLSNTMKYWETTFDWRTREAHIHSVDHYIAQVEDEGTVFDIHFVGHFSHDPEAIPLLLNHGWPGSLFEFLDVVKILRQSTKPAFHIIAPSQPGYSWSSPPPLDRGFGMFDCARILDKLMRGLGFGEYVAQGGDIGSVLARILACNYDSCKAINLNYLPVSAPESFDPENHGLSQREYADWARGATFAATGRGYAVMHGTKPSTIGFVVQSSPMALLAWLGEKFNSWSDEPPSLDQLLETVTIWWLRESFPTSIWAYTEILTGGVAEFHRRPDLYVHKPMGYSSFAKEISCAPKVWAAQTGNLHFYRYHEKGGHFAASERPEDFARDMQECFVTMQSK